ncbi:MAG: class II aldolase/adducin family protein [Propionibacteriaceae bacterium]|nr:class II aldolase/adducin family protein [Propionibacteriaceae bacterium]
MTTLADILTELGKAGRRLDQLHACEAQAGNMSVALAQAPDLSLFPDAEDYVLPAVVPALAGWTVIVTGSGTRLRDVADEPAACLAAVQIDDDGVHAVLHSAPTRSFARPTSEFNSHLGVHADQVARRPGLGMHTLVHAQPRYLVALSHIPELVDTTAMSRAITRWEPETLIQLPDGVGVLPFAVPGSRELMDGNVALLRTHQIVLWCKHGIMVRSDDGPLSAVDKVEYAETGATYEYWNRSGAGSGQGLTPDEIRAVIAAFGVQTSLY